MWITPSRTPRPTLGKHLANMKGALDSASADGRTGTNYLKEGNYRYPGEGSVLYEDAARMGSSRRAVNGS